MAFSMKIPQFNTPDSNSTPRPSNPFNNLSTQKSTSLMPKQQLNMQSNQLPNSSINSTSSSTSSQYTNRLPQSSFPDMMNSFLGNSSGGKCEKTILLNGEWEIGEGKKRLMIFPYDGGIYNLSSIDIVVSGSGMVKVVVMDVLENVQLCEINKTLTGGFTQMNCNEFTFVPKQNTIVEIFGVGAASNNVKVNAVLVTL